MRRTCGSECAVLRRRRLAIEKHAARPKRPREYRACLDCGRDISERRTTSIRCYDCQVIYRRGVGNQQAKDRWASLHADERGRRKLSYHLKTAYGITIEEYDAMKAKQKGLCAICGYPPKGRGRQDTLVVDHNHATGTARALLCGNCNSGLGLFAEDREVLIRAVGYLTKWNLAP